ncbi:STAS domain-containing protein [Aneurinibacillus tyrosinisolvens]|uniref:STAS domain-containing protein n=1 Tax=Aneurinibacillus tyrosinisolvens TaxID=1443435 RepID=UPI00063F98E1|nr:STAS domain-containing protein [Aneurinibacillus tyrosinisolvens]
MNTSEELQTFLLNKAKQLTEQWYNSLDKSDPAGVYASTDPDIIKTLKEQNFEFHLHFCQVFVEEETSFYRNLNDWILEIAKDEQHLKTPIHFIVREFTRVRQQYLSFIKEFVSLYEKKITQQQMESWNETIINTFDRIILWFVEEIDNYSKSLLRAQQGKINELSSPIITLNNNTGLLPLVGDIDAARAKFILENTINQCANKKIVHLFIDLSGVAKMDTMVAYSIFQLIDALNLIGVESTLSGIRPEIAAAAVQLGLSFDKASITSTLAQAITFNNERLKKK